MKENEAYKKAIRCVLYACTELDFDYEEEVEMLQILFRDLHYAEKREKEGKQ